MNIKKIFIVLVTVCSMLFVWSPMPASAASFVLQTANNVTGNQPGLLTGPWNSVGVIFNVNSAVSVSALGIYDSDQNGIAAPLNAPLSAYLFNNAGGVVANMIFDIGSQGTLDAASKYRFKDITRVTLEPGIYYLVGYGWSYSDPEHNISWDQHGLIPDTFNDGGGLLTFLSSVWGGPVDPAGKFPTWGADGWDSFSAANMKFDGTNEVPEPTTMLLLGIGLMGIAAVRKLRT